MSQNSCNEFEIVIIDIIDIIIDILVLNYFLLLSIQNVVGNNFFFGLEQGNHKIITFFIYLKLISFDQSIMHQTFAFIS